MDIDKAINELYESFSATGLIEEYAKMAMKSHAESLKKFTGLVDSVLRDHPSFKKISICKHLAEVCDEGENLADIQTTTVAGDAQYILKNDTLWMANAQFYIIKKSNHHLMMPVLDKLMQETTYSYDYKTHTLHFVIREENPEDNVETLAADVKDVKIDVTPFEPSYKSYSQKDQSGRSQEKVTPQ